VQAAAECGPSDIRLHLYAAVYYALYILHKFVNVHHVLLIHVIVRVIILYVVLLCTALFVVNIIRLLVEILGFVVVVSVGRWKIFC